jgi:hypothetical protein
LRDEAIVNVEAALPLRAGLKTLPAECARPGRSNRPFLNVCKNTRAGRLAALLCPGRAHSGPDESQRSKRVFRQALSEEDRAAGRQRQALATLGGKAHRSVRGRVVWIGLAGGGTLRLVSNVPSEELSAAEVGLLYRRRWQMECFFRWLKCLLNSRHWLAESRAGVTIQLYLALIAAVLFQLHTGRRPNRRMLELFQLHQLGWASTDGLIAGLQREQEREERRKRKRSK